MPTNTYVALDKVTTNGSTSTITFSSIPATYTDLTLVIQGSNSNVANARWRINGDTGANYSWTGLGGTGSAAASTRISNTSTPQLDWYGYFDSTQSNLITHFMNYSSTTTNKIVLSRSNNASNGVAVTAGLWQNTAAINTISIISSNGNWDTGTTLSLYGIKAQVTPGTAKATGGTITYDNSGNVIHTFTSSGTFTPSQALSVDYLVIAGGGGGNGGKAAQFAGAGGGAGTGYTSSLSLTTTPYTVEVGAGGSGGPFNTGKGGDGTSSIFASVTATGGTGVAFDSRTGGSNAIYSGGTTTGNPAGGGAGSAANGVDINGGNGILSSIDGNWVTRGGGGSAAGGTPGTGGGGQGRAGSQAGGSGSTNTGSGGGGAGDAFSGGAGGSGIVIVRYSGL